MGGLKELQRLAMWAWDSKGGVGPASMRDFELIKDAICQDASGGPASSHRGKENMPQKRRSALRQQTATDADLHTPAAKTRRISSGTAGGSRSTPVTRSTPLGRFADQTPAVRQPKTPGAPSSAGAAGDRERGCTASASAACKAGEVAPPSAAAAAPVLAAAAADAGVLSPPMTLPLKLRDRRKNSSLLSPVMPALQLGTPGSAGGVQALGSPEERELPRQPLLEEDDAEDCAGNCAEGSACDMGEPDPTPHAAGDAGAMQLQFLADAAAEAANTPSAEGTPSKAAGLLLAAARQASQEVAEELAGSQEEAGTQLPEVEPQLQAAGAAPVPASRCAPPRKLWLRQLAQAGGSSSMPLPDDAAVAPGPAAVQAPQGPPRFRMRLAALQDQEQHVSPPRRVEEAEDQGGSCASAAAGERPAEGHAQPQLRASEQQRPRSAAAPAATRAVRSRRQNASPPRVLPGRGPTGCCSRKTSIQAAGFTARVPHVPAAGVPRAPTPQATMAGLRIPHVQSRDVLSLQPLKLQAAVVQPAAAATPAAVAPLNIAPLKVPLQLSSEAAWQRACEQPWIIHQELERARSVLLGAEMQAALARVQTADAAQSGGAGAAVAPAVAASPAVGSGVVEPPAGMLAARTNVAAGAGQRAAGEQMKRGSGAAAGGKENADQFGLEPRQRRVQWAM